MTIEISIIIPIFNAQATLVACIDSVLNQTETCYELILVDDGSLDDSFEICKGYQKRDMRVKAVTQKNTGPSGAKNTGIKMAQGKYLYFMDADDTIDATMLEELYTCFERQKVDLAITGYVIHEMKNVNESNEIVICRVPNQIGEGINISAKVFMDLYNAPLINQNWNKLYKKHLIDKNNIMFDTKSSLGEDLFFNLEYLSQVNNVSIIGTTPYHFMCLNTNSLSKKFRTDFFGIQKNIYEHVREFLMNKYPYEYKGCLHQLNQNFFESAISYISVLSRSEHYIGSEKIVLVKKVTRDKMMRMIFKDIKGRSMKHRIISLLALLRLERLLVYLLGKR